MFEDIQLNSGESSSSSSYYQIQGNHKGSESLIGQDNDESGDNDKDRVKESASLIGKDNDESRDNDKVKENEPLIGQNSDKSEPDLNKNDSSDHGEREYDTKIVKKL